MFKRTLLVLEPGSHPDAMIQASLAMARPRLAEIVIFTPLKHPRMPASDLPDPVMAAQWDTRDDERQLVDHLQVQAQQTADAQGLLARSVRATGGDPVRSIIDAAHANHCDVIVATSERSNAVVRLLSGSLIPGLVTASPIPVMVCPGQPMRERTRSVEIARILVILEASDTGGSIHAQALELARTRGAHLIFAHVTPAGMGPLLDVAGMVSNTDDRLGAELRLQSQRLLTSACRLAARAGVTARSIDMAPGMTAKEIAEVAVDEGCEFIVLGHRGSNAVMRILTGSLIPRLISAATMPVLICRESSDPPKRRTPRRRRHRHRGAAATAAAHAAQLHAR